MLIDVNRTTERSINLIEDRISQLKKILADADRKITLLSSEQKKIEISSSYTTSLNNLSSEKQLMQHAKSTAVQTAADKYKKNAADPKKRINPKSSYELTPDGFKQTASEKQPVLFSEDEKKVGAHSGSAYTEVPIVAPDIYMSDDPIVKKKDFTVEVQKLYEQGETVDQIASALSSSVTEVQFAIDMNENL
jgi:hypothetical protein